ncbi:MAG: hypothetical protein GXX96_03560 [Planctomycetaceae bacterium]|nr:hypothetical protein [Planctomycetaceae bacterium]
MFSPGKIAQHLILCALAVGMGCTPIRPETDRSPLRAAQMSPDSVTLDVFFVRCPFGDESVNQELWREVDEQQFPVETRRRLAANGLRVGVISGQVPIALSQLLELKQKSTPIGGPQTTPLAEIGSEEGPMWSHQQLRAGKRSEINTSIIYPELPVLLSGPDGVSGETYKLAQGVMAVRAVPEKDGRVTLEVVPELHHDEHQRNITGSQGAWRIDNSRPRLVFDDMAVSACLAPGNMIVLSCLPDRLGTLGYHFLTTDSSGSLEQKLLVIRLAQTQHDELFEPTPIPLDHVP